MSDTEGGSAAAPRDICPEKAEVGIGKKFHHLPNFKSKLVKAKAFQLCYNLNLNQIKFKRNYRDQNNNLDFFSLPRPIKKGAFFAQLWLRINLGRMTSRGFFWSIYLSSNWGMKFWYQYQG